MAAVLERTVARLGIGDAEVETVPMSVIARVHGPEGPSPAPRTVRSSSSPSATSPPNSSAPARCEPTSRAPDRVSAVNRVPAARFPAAGYSIGGPHVGGRSGVGMVMVPFEQVVAEHGALVWRVCRALLADADADDAWSETFMAALRAYPDLRPDSNVTGWLVTIAHRKAIDVHRARGRRPVPVGDVPERAAAADEAAMDEDLAAALLRTAAQAARGGGAAPPRRSAVRRGRRGDGHLGRRRPPQRRRRHRRPPPPPRPHPQSSDPEYSGGPHVWRGGERWRGVNENTGPVGPAGRCARRSTIGWPAFMTSLGARAAAAELLDVDYRTLDSPLGRC